MGVYDQIKQAFQDLVSPKIHELRGDSAVIRGHLERLDDKMDGLDSRLTTKIDSLRAEMISEFRRVDVRIDALEREVRTALDIRERLAALEARRPV